MTVPEQNSENQFVEGQVFKETLDVETDRTEPTIGTLQADFGLCEADFLRIKNGYPKIVITAHSILLVAFGLGISILAKYIDKIVNNSKILIFPWETYGCIIALIISGFLYGIGFFLPNEKKKVMKDIENHFESSPRTRHIVSK